jgi:two-component system LytT family response regulator
MPEARRIRALIVDDEAPARGLLREYLGAHSDVEVVGECANGFEAVKTIGEVAPDLVFLDVQMPKLDGFEVLELLERPPVVIFVTAYDAYALRAFEVHAVDYVLKPVGRERFDEALARARERVAIGAAAVLPRPARVAVEVDDDGDEVTPPPAAGPPTPGALAAAARAPGQHLERILVKDGAQVHVIPVARLDYLEAQDDYVAVHAEGKTHLKPQTLAEIAAGLDPARFVRIHRSFMLNVERLARLELMGKESRVAVLKDGKELPVSRAGYARLKELM